MLPVADILQPLKDGLEAPLTFLHDDAGFGWGMAIVGLTFLVRAALLPLSLRGIRSMRRMQVLAPHLQAVREKYKDDPQRFQKETMKVYQEHGVNPLSSCFPFILQIPFFIGLYQLLNGAGFRADVEGGGGNPGWLFIDSLVADPTGGEMIALILLFIGTTIPTFLLTTTTTTVNPSQRYIFMALPVLISPFIASLPAGLAVYWIATNIWSLGQQAVVQRMMPAPPQPTPEEIKAAKPPPPPPRKRKRRR